MHLFTAYILFLLKTLTLIGAMFGTFIGILNVLSKKKHTDKDKLKIKVLNHHYDNLSHRLHQTILSKKEYKQHQKACKAHSHTHKKRIFVLDFQGDLKASEVTALREMVTSLLQVATVEDEIVIRLESSGGTVQGYGLAAAQLERIRQKEIPLTISIDKVAASGGYLMACVANKIIAAPFSIIGSIGVVTQFPNFNRLLKKNWIDFEMLTAGDYKRTLTVFGENEEPGREKMKEQLNVIHDNFKSFLQKNRPVIDIKTVATGEHWLATEALKLNLVDTIMTSDEYLLEAHSQNNALYHLEYTLPKPSWKEKLGLDFKSQYFI